MNASPEQATSFVNFYDSMRAKMERMMSSSGGFDSEVGERKQRTPTIPRRHLKSDAERIAMVNDVLALVKCGESWRSAAGQKGQGYDPSSVVAMAKKYGLYKSSRLMKDFSQDRANADKQLPLIEERRKSGLLVREALEGTGVTADQYYRAKDRKAANK